MTDLITAHHRLGTFGVYISLNDKASEKNPLAINIGTYLNVANIFNFKNDFRIVSGKTRLESQNGKGQVYTLSELTFRSRVFEE